MRIVLVVGYDVFAEFVINIIIIKIFVNLPPVIEAHGVNSFVCRIAPAEWPESPPAEQPESPSRQIDQAPRVDRDNL